MIGRIFTGAKNLWQIKTNYPQGPVSFIIGISNSLSRTPDGKVRASSNTRAVALKCAELYQYGWSRRILLSGCFGEKEFGVSEKGKSQKQGVIIAFHPLQSRRGTAIFKHWFSMYGIPVYPIPSEMSVNESRRAATQFQFKYGEAFYFFYEIGLHLDFKLTRGLLAKILAKFMPPIE